MVAIVLPSVFQGKGLKAQLLYAAEKGGFVDAQVAGGGRVVAVPPFQGCADGLDVDLVMGGPHGGHFSPPSGERGQFGR